MPMGIADPGADPGRRHARHDGLARKHRFGRHVYRLGGNPESAELAGIDTPADDRPGLRADGPPLRLASIVITARLNAGASVTGTMTELNVIAAAVIGGTSLAGGIGTIYGAVLGAVIMQSLESGMILMGVPDAAAEDGARGRADRSRSGSTCSTGGSADMTRPARRDARHLEDLRRRARGRERRASISAPARWSGCSATTAPASRR